MKLIVSDLDGTLLLKGEKRLNKNIINTIRKITENNAFAVASGRTYTELRRIFSETDENNIYFIASDGALAVHKGETLFEKRLAGEYSEIGEYTAHGKYITYVKSKSGMFIRAMREKYGGHVLQIESAEEMTEPIYKICDYEKKADIPLAKIYEDGSLREYVAEGVNKGEAVKLLAERLGMSPEECFVFGDNTNDIEMLAFTKNSYAMITAKPSVKRRAEHIAQSFASEAEKLF